MTSRAPILLLLVSAAACTSRPPDARVAQSAQKVCQLTGEYDHSFAPPQFTTNRTETHARLAGTDLGVSFRGPFGSVFFFFGDSVPSSPYAPEGGSDAVAYARADAHPDDCVSLTFYTSNPGHEFKPPSVQGEPLGVFGVPTGAFFANGNTYVFFMNKLGAGDPKGFPNHSFLARAAGVPADKLEFQKLRDLPQPWMLGVSPVAVDDSLRPSAQPTQVLLFAAGPYRRDTTLHLVRVRVSEIEAGQFQSLTGVDANGAPEWSKKGDVPAAAPHSLLAKGSVNFGEFSVAYNSFLNRWLLLVESNGTIHLRSAVHPWGPWSEATELFKSDEPAGHCAFMFTGDPSTACPAGMTNPRDTLIPEGPQNPRAKQPGSAYGPFIIDAYTTGDSARRTSTIYFAMSTWNPYQVVLMRAELARDLTVGEEVRSWFSPGAASGQRQTGSH